MNKGAPWLNDAFWTSSQPWMASDHELKYPDLPELRGHICFETSGSSGQPKWIALPKSALLASAKAVNQHLNVTQNTRWGLALPLRHVGGFGVLARAHEAACALEKFPCRWEPRNFSTWLELSGITHTSLVPTQVHDLVVSSSPAPKCLAALVVGGGKLDSATGAAARSLGWPVLASYGMTEASSQIATQRLEALERPFENAPLPVLPHWQTRTSSDGLLEIFGEALFSGVLSVSDGIWNWQPRPDAWFQTQDRVTVSSQGLTPLGRADTRFKVLGELVDPEAIEQELHTLCHGTCPPGSLIVTAVPHDRSENLLVAVAETPLANGPLPQALIEYAATAPGFRRLHCVIWVEALPRSPLGKPRRAEIARMVHATMMSPNHHADHSYATPQPSVRLL